MAGKTQKAPKDLDKRRGLPSVASLIDHPSIVSLLKASPRPFVVDAVRDALDHFRKSLKSQNTLPSIEDVVALASDFLQARELDRVRPVVNATGILLHTGLGRAVLPKRAAEALARLDRCCNLQVDLATGLRGKRNYMCEHLLCQLTGAEAALVVNNNAAATLLIMTALCADREVIVSRGQLIEIGGSYRLPDCVHQSGARLVEVGTTNKTHLRDYEAALTESTGAVMRVNPSNFRVVGFTKEVTIQELCSLKQRGEVLIIDDLGCGALLDLERFGLPHEPTVQDSVAAGADLVCFSGDKLIGGPQAGIIVGRKELVQRLKKHPLNRMLRVGKMTDLALEQTLRLFLNPETLIEENPTLHMLAMPAEALRVRAEALRNQVAEAQLPLQVQVREAESATGGGSLPHIGIPTFVLAVTCPSCSAEELSARLRRHEPPVIARIKDNEVWLDLRTLMDGDDELVLDALRGCSV